MSQDYIVVDGVKYELLPGYEASLTHSEIANIKTMASGVKRKDFLRKSTKIKFTYKTATQEILDKMNAIYEKSLTCETMKITVELRMKDRHEIYDLSIISVPKYNISFRGNLIFYSNLEVEIE